MYALQEAAWDSHSRARLVLPQISYANLISDKAQSILAQRRNHPRLFYRSILHIQL